MQRSQLTAGLLCTILSLAACRTAPERPRWSIDDPARATMVAGTPEAANLFEAAARACGLTGLGRENRNGVVYISIREVPISEFYGSQPIQCAIAWIKEHPDAKLVVYGPPTVPAEPA